MRRNCPLSPARARGGSYPIQPRNPWAHIGPITARLAEVGETANSRGRKCQFLGVLHGFFGGRLGGHSQTCPLTCANARHEILRWTNLPQKLYRSRNSWHFWHIVLAVGGMRHIGPIAAVELSQPKSSRLPRHGPTKWQRTSSTRPHHHRHTMEGPHNSIPNEQKRGGSQAQVQR